MQKINSRVAFCKHLPNPAVLQDVTNFCGSCFSAGGRVMLKKNNPDLRQRFILTGAVRRLVAINAFKRISYLRERSSWQTCHVLWHDHCMRKGYNRLIGVRHRGKQLLRTCKGTFRGRFGGTAPFLCAAHGAVLRGFGRLPILLVCFYCYCGLLEDSVGYSFSVVGSKW